MRGKLLLLNGPNLNLLGEREIDIYGKFTLSDVESLVKKTAEAKGFSVDSFQSNSESELIDRIQQAKQKYDGIIINPAAYSHTSVAIHDAIKAVSLPVIEVHISNIYKRETFRQQSITASACLGQIAGLGIDEYQLATIALMNMITRKDDLHE